MENNILYSFANHSQVQKSGGPKVINRGEGCFVWDVEGKRYIDGFSGLQLVNIGHGRTEVIEAVYKQMKELEYWHCFGGFVPHTTAKLAEKISTLTPGGLKTFHFVNSGSEGNDTAFKIARAYFKKKGLAKYKIIYRDKAYHGMTLGAISASGVSQFKTPYEPLIPGFVDIPNCHCYRCPFDKTYPSCNIDCAWVLEKRILKEGPESVAAFIVDPVQGTSGGYIPAVEEYFPIIREICDKYQVLLIDDEVVTGFGRTGKMFGIEHYPGVLPDIMVMAKGLCSGYQPIGAVVSSEEIFSTLQDSMFTHGFTYGGHPAATAAALANIDIIEKEDLVKKAHETGEYISGLLKDFTQHKSIGEVRSKGMMFALEVVQNKETKEPFPKNKPFVDMVFEAAYKKGLIIRQGSSGCSLLICPPLIMTRKIADKMVEILGEAIIEVEKEYEL